MTTPNIEPKKTLPGNCVPIPEVRAEIHDTHGQVGWVIETHVVPGLDLDSHGSPVVLVPPHRQGMNQFSMWWRLFIQRGDCGHELGIIIGMEDPVLELDESHGMRNFSMVESISTDANDGLRDIGTTIYVFNGERYVGSRTE
jgi:hypothetical protein